MTSIASAIGAVAAVVPAGSRVLDIGCGSGEFAADLSARGYRVVGIEPQESRVAEARARCPECEFMVAGAEALPFADSSFDAAVMIYALHHVPVQLMRKALTEAVRCTAAAAPLIVLEPLAEGSFHAVFRLIDDETAVRREAQTALEEACRSGLLHRKAAWQWDLAGIYRDVDDFIQQVTAVDQTRARTAAALKPDILEAFNANGTAVPEGYSFREPVRADVFYR